MQAEGLRWLGAAERLEGETTKKPRKTPMQPRGYKRENAEFLPHYEDNAHSLR
jgi:hypothetical protein